MRPPVGKPILATATLCALLLSAAVVVLSVSVEVSAAVPSVPASCQTEASVPLQDDTTVPYVGAPHPPYNSLPPTSGAHVPQSLTPGIYSSPVPLQMQVSVLRVGHVIVQYSQGTPLSQVAELEEIARHYFRSVVLAPAPTSRPGITLTSYGHLKHLDSVQAVKIREFIQDCNA
jgi:hypothetical protein